jgi:16S rRNA pseudouridine516 synthase
MPIQRLDKLLTGTGLCSRREASAQIKRGALSVDGTICRDPAYKVDAQQVTVLYRGQRIGCQQYVYLLLNKPLGVVSAREDEQKTVLDLLPPQYHARGVFPMGRLDKETAGLLVLTDDGALSHAVLSPRHHVAKVYRAVTDGVLGQEDIDAFAQGITLRDGTQCRPAQLVIEHSKDGTSQVLVTLHEGKYHQVRRMLASRGAPVLQLTRIAEGPLTLDPALAPGQWRELTEQEITALRLCAGEKTE